MSKRTIQILTFIVTLCLMLPALAAYGQDRRLTYENWYGDVKKTLADHYTGKTVKLRMAIPATRRGLEMVDGSFDRAAVPVSTETLAQSGDDVTIQNFIVRDTDIELLLNKNGEKPKGWFFPKKPRIKLRFSRELTAKDMTIETINRWLAPALDVTALASTQEASIAPPVAPPKEAAPQPVVAKTSSENAAGLPTPEIIGDLPKSEARLAELTVECPGKYARVYIDSAYSGYAPRTIRLRAGVHSILVMADGYSAWEQRLFIPGGKASVVKAEPAK
ncbi:MAG: PEGA domain-containing protein [Acidobacteriota bacterium]|nr:PEGA domain-containing protein [Acidobacteriota bacterium]